MHESLKRKDAQMEEISKDLRAYIEKAVLPLYEDFDKAHGPGHVGRVIENSMELVGAARELYGQVDADMVYAIAAYHDTGLQFGREDHGVTSGQYLAGDEALRRWFTEEQIAVMREAVEDHRASAGREPRSVYGRIISEADRELEPGRVVERCIEYGLGHYPDLTGEEQIERAVAHMKEKYAEGGYMHSYLPCRKNKEGLMALRRWLETGEIYEVCKKYIVESQAGQGAQA